MKWVFYVAALLAAAVIPAEKTDVATLIPVEVVMVSRGEGMVLQTDTENSGYGNDLKEAIANLRESASGRIYLETVAYVLIEEEEMSRVSEYRMLAKRGARIYGYAGDVDPKTAAEYLDIHAGKDGSDNLVLVKMGGQYTLKNN